MLPAGKRLGPYEIVSLIASGGMGEVYRARDPRLGRDVALKVIRGELVEGGDRRRRFEREGRAAALLNHPNILTVHDVGSADGTAYVVTELLEGETLRAVLSRRSPAQHQTLSYAVQAAQGLAAAHQRGIVHRDLKPENLFLTADGRVKILDFGLAKLDSATRADSEEASGERSTRPGVLLGTVAYMSPEQVKALVVDAQSDIFSFGVVLYELLSRRHPFRRETVAATLTAILQETPPDLTSLDPAIPPALGGIVRRCLEKEKEQRFHGAHDLALALEAVMATPTGTASVGDVEDRSPYPGLASFTERDAAFFFGREAEVEALWQRLQNRRLLAVIGPSGTGKTSLVRAGVIASRPAGWSALVCTPGAAPFRALGRALAPELAGDPDALRRLLSFEETETAVDLVGRWRRAHAEALLVVDQFEELFTLNPREPQERFVALLARLAGEADVRVLLSMRDDFLIRCSEHEALAPVFESLTPLTGLGASALRRALVEPAGRRGYRFEDGTLVEEMIQSVEGSRGALPLLAFAVARLWEVRDRDRKVLTRKAYEEIAGVAGALAQHAEAAMERIGPDRQAIVRDIFRSLVTAEGTRAVADREELLSLFPERAGDAAVVLEELIDARLLTSYDLKGAEGQPARHRVEVVHESLLKAWPRLVRWQAQDEEGAVLRDQLKQAAHLWDDKGRTADLLWTGTAYREFELWRERYAGALTTVEKAFARSMSDKARRRKRLWTAVVGSMIVALAGIAIAIGASRNQATKARDEAKAEALRAEAGKLLALGRTEIDRYPTAALAYARKSLDLADTPEARRFVVEVLWRGPVARILPVARIAKQTGLPESVIFEPIALSPDDRWLATRSGDGRILLFPQDGGPPRALATPTHAEAAALGFDQLTNASFLPAGDRLVSTDSSGKIRLRSPDAAPRVLGTTSGLFRGVHAVDREGRRVAAGDANASVAVWDLRDPPDALPLSLKRPDPADCLTTAFDSTGAWLATNNGFAVALWPLGGSWMRTLRGHRGLSYHLSFSPDGRWLASCPVGEPARLWPLDPSDGGLRALVPAQPCFALAFHPAGTYVLVGAVGGAAFLYPIAGGSARALETGWEGAVSPGTRALAIDAQRGRAAACPFDLNPSIRDPRLRVLRVWDLGSGKGRTFSLTHLTDSFWYGLYEMRFAPDGSLIAAGPGGVSRLVLPADPRGSVSSEMLYAAGRAGLDLSSDGRHVLIRAGRNVRSDHFEELLLFDLASRRLRRITTHGQRVRAAAFDSSGQLIVTGDIDGVVRVGRVTGEEPHLLLGHAGVVWAVALSPDGGWIASLSDDALNLWPMPDLSRPPLHTLPHDELLAKLDSLTNLRVVADPSFSTGWKLDVGPFPGWKDVPTW